MLRWASSRDLRTWHELSFSSPGVTTPQLVWFNGRLVTFCASATRLAVVELTVGDNGCTGVGAPLPIEIAGESADIQVDPDVVALSDKRYRVYYTTSRASNDPAYLATEIHSATWTSGHWVRDAGIRLQGDGIVDPDVIRLNDGTWRMLFTRGIEKEVGSARSADALDFKVEPGSRLNGQVTSTIAVADGYLTAYQTFGGRYNQGLLHLAHSDDGFRFTPDARFTWEEKNVATEAPSIARLPNGTHLLAYVTSASRRPAQGVR